MQRSQAPRGRSGRREVAGKEGAFRTQSVTRGPTPASPPPPGKWLRGGKPAVTVEFAHSVVHKGFK